MPLKSMQKSIKEQDKMRRYKLGVLFILFSLLQVGCSTLSVPKSNKIFSCEEEVVPKSLQYIEQQYRCTTNK